MGGIIRDIFTMGARPTLLTNSLRFGDLDTQEGTETSMALESVSRAVEAKIESDGYRWGVYNVAGTERYPLRAAKGLPLQLGRVT